MYYWKKKINQPQSYSSVVCMEKIITTEIVNTSDTENRTGNECLYTLILHEI